MLHVSRLHGPKVSFPFSFMISELPPPELPPVEGNPDEEPAELEIHANGDAGMYEATSTPFHFNQTMEMDGGSFLPGDASIDSRLQMAI